MNENNNTEEKVVEEEKAANPINKVKTLRRF